MKPFYIILPALLLAGFSFLFLKEQERLEAADKVRVAQKALTDAEELRRKEDEARKARESAARRQAEREADEKRKELERRAKWDAESAHIAGETEKHLSKARELAGTVAKLSGTLADLRQQKERRSKELFAKQEANELLTIDKRNLELEAQRLVRRIALSTAGTGDGKTGSEKLDPARAVPPV